MKSPKGEHVWEGYYDINGNLKFIITSKENRDQYFLYECVDGEFRKLGKAKTPPDLAEKFDIARKIGVTND